MVATGSSIGARPERVELETLLVHEIGQFGRYQRRVLALSALVSALSALSASEFIFTTGRINTRCLIPECEDPLRPAQFEPPWILNAVPAGGGPGGFDNCHRFANTSASLFDDTCSAALFDQNSLLSCDQYVYENTNTVVFDYDLACNEWLRSLIGSARTFGTLVALPVTGFVSDRWGRRTALTINAFNTAWMGFLRYWAGTYVGFVISVFVESALGAGGMLSCGYILLMEVVGPEYRVMAGAITNTFFAVGQVVLGLVAWGLPDWRHFTLAIYTPQLLTLSFLWIMPESIRWYMSKGHYEESETILKQMARVNGTKLSEKSLIALRENAEDEKARKALEKPQNEPWLVVLVFRNKPILLRCLVTPVWWVSFTCIYYGLSINAVNISGNRYLNYIAVSAVEIPGFWAAWMLIGRVGRKPVLLVAFWICAACQIGYIFVPNDLYGVSLTVYLIGKFAIASVVTTVYLYTSELYPTKYRHSLFAFSSMIGRIGSIVAPLTPALGAAVWTELPFVLFAVLAFLSGLLAFVTPETLGSALPDTMQQAADIGSARRMAGNKKQNKYYVSQL